MRFGIRLLQDVDSLRPCGEITIGEFREKFPLITNAWSVSDYERQWKSALEALVDRSVDRCILITDIQSPEISYGITFWALFKEIGSVFIQERFVRKDPALFSAPPVEIEQHIAPRIQGSIEEHARVSEWEISIGDISDFLREL